MMKIIRRKRPYSIEEYSTILKGLEMMHIIIIHTCVHKDQPVLSLDMAKHVLSEVQRIIGKVEDMPKDLKGCIHTHGYPKFKAALHNLKYILYALHTEILEILSRNQTAPGFDSVKAALTKSCPIIWQEFEKLVHNLYDMDLISKDDAMSFSHSLNINGGI